MRDREFEQMSDEHTKAMSTDKCQVCGGTLDARGHCLDCNPQHKPCEPPSATPAPSQPAGARELEEFIYVALEYGRKWKKSDGYVVAEIMRKVEAQAAAKDAEIERLTKVVADTLASRDEWVQRAEAAERERDSLRVENAALKAGKDGHGS